MSSAFTHSLRSLQADRNNFSLVVLALAGLLLLGWLAWFVLAPVTLYETGEIVQTSSDGVVVAHFPSTAQTRLHSGQAGQLHFADVPPDLAVSATVAEVGAQANGDAVAVTLYVDLDDPNATVLHNGLTGQATVAVEQLSPAQLVLRATGYGVDTPAVSFEAAP